MNAPTTATRPAFVASDTHPDQLYPTPHNVEAMEDCQLQVMLWRGRSYANLNLWHSVGHMRVCIKPAQLRILARQMADAADQLEGIQA